MQWTGARRSSRLAVLPLAAIMAAGLIATFTGPASADESATDTTPTLFDCPPAPGIYPEPDPCVPTPPPPELPDFTASLDPWPVAPDWYCEPETKPGVIEFTGILRDAYGIGGSTTRECDASWSYEFSYHKMGLALDWRVDTTDPYEWASGLSFLRWLLGTDSEGNEFAMARRIGITQLIWHNMVWSAHDPTWRVYCDPRDPAGDLCIGDATSRHDDHMHISFSLESGYLHTSFFDALGLKPLTIPLPPEPPADDEVTPDEEAASEESKATG